MNDSKDRSTYDAYYGFVVDELGENWNFCPEVLEIDLLWKYLDEPENLLETDKKDLDKRYLRNDGTVRRRKAVSDLVEQETILAKKAITAFYERYFGIVSIETKMLPHYRFRIEEIVRNAATAILELKGKKKDVKKLDVVAFVLPSGDTQVDVFVDYKDGVMWNPKITFKGRVNTEGEAAYAEAILRLNELWT